MSKTDKTKPYHLKQEEYRNHFPRTQDDWPRTYRAYQWWRGVFRCSCDMCSQYAKEEGKKRRREGKREARDWWKD